MLNILLIEDDIVDVMSVQRMFKKNQVLNSLYLANSGLEALALLHHKKHQSPVFKENLLILLDYYLPDMNGGEFLDELRFYDDLREIPVIICMSHEEMKIQTEIAYGNVVGYLKKPIALSEVTKILKHDWDRRQKAEQWNYSLISRIF